MAESFQLGKYNLHEIIGRGGFGTIYRAEDTVLHIPRAIKILHPALNADPVFLERFRQEARLSARLDHPNIVPVYELDQIDGSYFLVMRLMEGGSLRDLLEKDGPLPFEKSLAILEQVAAGLDYAHNLPERLIHRDLKPGNILFEPNGTARIADLGFAKALAGANSVSLSITGGLIGTPAYMPPEIWQDEPVGPATDIYSLSCVFFEMITGQVLFQGNSPAEIMTHHVIDGPRLPPVWPEGVPQGLEVILARALSASPENRYESGGALIQAIREAATAVEPDPATPVEAEQALTAFQDAAPDEGPDTKETEDGMLPSHSPDDEGLTDPVVPKPETPEPAIFRTDPTATRLQKRPIFDKAGAASASERPVTAPSPEPPAPPENPAIPESSPPKRSWMPWVVAGSILIFLCCCLLALIWKALGLVPQIPVVTPTVIVGAALPAAATVVPKHLSARESHSFDKMGLHNHSDSDHSTLSSDRGAPG